MMSLSVIGRILFRAVAWGKVATHLHQPTRLLRRAYNLLIHTKGLLSRPLLEFPLSFSYSMSGRGMSVCASSSLLMRWMSCWKRCEQRHGSGSWTLSGDYNFISVTQADFFFAEKSSHSTKYWAHVSRLQNSSSRLRTFGIPCTYYTILVFYNILLVFEKIRLGGAETRSYDIDIETHRESTIWTALFFCQPAPTAPEFAGEGRDCQAEIERALPQGRPPRLHFCASSQALAAGTGERIRARLRPRSCIRLLPLPLLL